MDWILHPRFAVGVTGHYLWAGEFDRPASGWDNMSSFAFEFSLALLLGRGRKGSARTGFRMLPLRSGIASPHDGFPSSERTHPSPVS